MKTTVYTILLLSVFFVSCSGSNSKNTTDLTFKGGELRYTDSVTETQAKALGNFLVKADFFDETPRTVQLDKINGIIHFAMVVDDSVVNSPEFQTTGIVIIEELQQNVFTENTVEVDYCDAYFKVIKNIKGGSDVAPFIDTTQTSTKSPDEAILYSWVCNSLTGGDVSGARDRAADVEWLKKNFYFFFSEDSTFFCNFINHADINTPVFIEGRYQITGNNISLHNLTIDGDEKDQEMHFGIEFNESGFRLTSKTPGKDDLVMSFVKAPGQ